MSKWALSKSLKDPMRGKKVHKHHGISLKSPFGLHLFLSAFQKWENGL